MLVEILEGSDGSSGVEVGLGHAVVGELDGVLVLPLVAVLKKKKCLRNYSNFIHRLVEHLHSH